MTDWIADPQLSAEEKIARFEALDPEPTRGPRDEAPALWRVQDSTSIVTTRPTAARVECRVWDLSSSMAPGAYDPSVSGHAPATA